MATYPDSIWGRNKAPISVHLSASTQGLSKRKKQVKLRFVQHDEKDELISSGHKEPYETNTKYLVGSRRDDTSKYLSIFQVEIAKNSENSQV